LARPPSNVYRLQKLFRRHRAALAATGGIAATLLIGAAVSAWLAVRATRAEHRAHIAQKLESHLRQQAEQQKASSRLNEYVADINLAKQSLDAGNLGRAVQLLEKHRPQPGEPDLRGFEWRYLWQLCQGDQHEALPDQKDAIRAIAFSPDGELAAIGLSQKVRILNLHTKTFFATLP